MTNTGKDTSETQGKPSGSPSSAQAWSGANLGEQTVERGCRCHAHCTAVHQTPTSYNPVSPVTGKAAEGGVSAPTLVGHMKDATPGLTLASTRGNPGPVLSGPKQSLHQVEGQGWGPGGVQGTGQFPFTL